LGEEGITCAASGDHDSAVAVLRQSLDLQQTHNLVAGGTIARLELCRSLLQLNRPLEALAEMEKALEYPTHQCSDQDDFFLANCYLKAGQHRNAIDILKRLLERSRREHNAVTEAACLGNLGHIHRTMGDPDTARGYLEEARKLHRLQGDADGEAEDVRQLAAIDGHLENEVPEDSKREPFDFWDALLVSPDAEARLTAMLRSARTQGDPLLEFNALDGLGVVARNRGALEEAIRLHEKAMKLTEGMEGIHGVVPKVVGNNNLGIAYRMLGDFDRARLCYRSSITSAREVSGINNPLELMPRANLTKLYLLEGNPEAARREYLDEPRIIASETDGLIDLDVRIGIFQELNDTASLLPALKEMAERCCAAGLNDREAEAYKLLGYTYYYAFGELSTAREFYDRALALLGSTEIGRRERADVLYYRSLVRFAQGDHSGAFADASESVRESGITAKQLSIESVKRFARIKDVERYAHLAVICGSLGRVPEALEYLERSRSGLLNALLATRRIAPSSYVPSELVSRFQELQTQRRRLDLLIVQEQEMPLSGGRLGVLIDQMMSMASVWDDTIAKIASYDPVFEQLRDVPIRYEQIEALIPRDKRTALLEFCVGATGTQVILVVPGVTQRAFTMERLSYRRLHQLLESKWFGPLRRLRMPTALSHKRPARVSDLEAMNEVLGELHDELFAQSVADGETLGSCLARCEVERLLVVPHGALHLLPFHALRRNSGGERHYLIDDFELIYAPSCSVLRYCSRDAAGCENLVAFADPDGSLHGARDEVDAIAHYFGESTVFRGAEATIEAAIRYGARSDVLHFACHGSFDSQSPLSSHLAMADGQMTLSHIFEEFRCKPGALVTLSACETGIVSPDRTDEYVGLPSGFLFAGANCVIGSLWPVYDTCTSTAMKNTYERIRKYNESPATSLRAAQRSLKSDGAYSHPYFWAPFQVVGTGWIRRQEIR
jgi:tetratricopeptide (TPR) repeat protein